MDVKPNQLTVLNLRYSSTAKSLKVLAFGGLAVKAIYLEDKPLSLKEIVLKVANLINIKSVDEKLIQEGLAEMQSLKEIKKVSGGMWELTQETKEKITKEISTHTEQTKRIVVNHFPIRIEESKIISWFSDATIEFFTAFGEDWVHSVCKSNSQILKLKPLNQILVNSIKKHKLEAEETQLIEGFKQFIGSNDYEDTQYIANLGYSMFSARLVAADVGADPITIDELKDATFIVDTNFLFALNLEGHKLSKSFEALGAALKFINANVVYIYETKEEYKRVVNGRKSNILSLLSKYKYSDVVMEVQDSFMITAKMRGCKELKHFETFFDSLNDLPKSIPNGPKIKILDDKEIKKLSEQARKDNNLKGAVQKWYAKNKSIWHPWQKSESQLCHDATLIKVVEFENKKKPKNYILTLDRSLQACAAERSGNHNIPEAIYLEGLIHILAANNAGPSLNAVDFGPLLASMLEKKCSPSPNTYNLDDLQWLLSIEKNVVNFDSDKIKVILVEIAKARLAGKNHNDTQLIRTVHRLYQSNLRIESEKLSEEIEKRITAETNYKEEVVKREKSDKIIFKKDIILQLIWRIPTTILISAIVYYLVRLALKEKESLLSIISGAISLLGIGYILIWDYIKLFFKEFFKRD